MAAGVMLAVALFGCRSPQDTGTLTLRLSMDPGDTDGLSQIEVVPDWAGANRGRERDANWFKIGVVTQSVVLPAPNGSALIAASGELPAGHYDRVFVAARLVRGETQVSGPDELADHIEPIARGFDLSAGEGVTIDIDLIAMPPSSQGNGHREVFVKDARNVGSASYATPRVPATP
jgi:hypothetical protein